MMPFIYAYCHGFLSSPSSTKGVHLKKVFQDRFAIHLHLLNLNGGEDVSKITFSTAFSAIDELWNSGYGLQKLRLIGTSFGGQTAGMLSKD